MFCCVHDNKPWHACDIFLEMIFRDVIFAYSYWRDDHHPGWRSMPLESSHQGEITGPHKVRSRGSCRDDGHPFGSWPNWGRKWGSRHRQCTLRCYLLFLVEMSIFMDKSETYVDVVYLKYFIDLTAIHNACLFYLNSKLGECCLWNTKQMTWSWMMFMII